jgi:sugar phosphate isomerase/epimerase
MKVGLDQYTIHHLPLDAHAVLDFAAARGLQGVQFGSPLQLSLTLDEAEIRAVRQYADDRGLYLELGIPTINPHQAALQFRWEPGAFAERLEELLRAAVWAGVHSVRTFIGAQSRPLPESVARRMDDLRNDSARPDVSWDQQLSDATKVLRQLAPAAHELGVRLALETHLDATSFQLLQMIESVGEDVVGICLDTANVMLRMEDPLEAARRLAPHVLMTHTKDAALLFHETGLRWQCRPCGQGSVPFPEILLELNRHRPDLTLSIEDHAGLFELPIYEADWIQTFSDLSPAELALLLRRAWATGRRLSSRRPEDPEVLETIPWSERVLPRLDASVRYLRDLVEELELDGELT